MTDNDRQRGDFNPINVGNPERTVWQCLTRKAVYDRLCPVMKPTTRKRIAQALFALALLALVIAQGLLESNPNH
jgi:hypothetical protein